MSRNSDTRTQPSVAEAEVKIALTAEESARLPGLLARLSFLPVGEEALTDYYLSYAVSPHGGWDFIRLRQVNAGTYLFTEKRWSHDSQGRAIRLETEYLLPAEEFSDRLAAGTPLMLQKTRVTFAGRIGTNEAHIVLDRLELHSRQYHFLECEMLTAPDGAADAREEILAWMRRHLALGAELHEAASMLELLLSAVPPAWADPDG